MNTEDRERQTEKVPTFVVVNISTSRRGLELITEALEYYHGRCLPDYDGMLEEIAAILDGLKG